MFRVRVLLKSPQGNDKEVVTLCETAEERDTRLTLYKNRYPEGDVFSEEVKDIESSRPRKDK